MVVLLLVGCDGGSSTRVASGGDERQRRPVLEAKTPSKGTDPGNVAGRWDYYTRSNCGSVKGIGEVWLEWDVETNAYKERGYVYWVDSRSKIDWWGRQRFTPGPPPTLVGTLDNSLGDAVKGKWRLMGNGPERLVVKWRQTNGCHGEGVASRPAGVLVMLRVRRLIQGLTDVKAVVRAESATKLGKLGRHASAAVVPLTEALGDGDAMVRAAARQALQSLAR